jgi:hypothetical protein
VRALDVQDGVRDGGVPEDQSVKVITNAVDDGNTVWNLVGKRLGTSFAWCGPHSASDAGEVASPD